jgi:hypothetical protein
MVNLCWGIISLSADQNPVTAQSSAEAELIAITDVVKNGLWLKRLLQELNLPVKQELIIECDNLPAIQLLQGSRRNELVWLMLKKGYVLK